MKIFPKKTILLISVILIILISNVTQAAFTEPTTAPSSSDQDFPQNILGANNNNNDFDSTNVTANNDGSLIERLEYIITSLSSLWTKVGNLLYYNTGNVGIGTSTPSALLEVSGDGQSALKVTDVTNSITTGIWSGTTQGSIGTLTNTDLRFLTNGTSKMTIDTSGNVGVGTTSPGSLFTLKTSDVDADAVFFTMLADDDGNVAKISKGNDDSGYLGIYDGDGNEDIRFSAYSGGYSWINNSNYVGIGTTTPTGTLTIEAGTYYPLKVMSNDGANLFLFGDDADRGHFDIYHQGTLGARLSPIHNSYFNTIGGNVGIGTTVPTSKLYIYNTADTPELTIIGDGYDSSTDIVSYRNIGGQATLFGSFSRGTMASPVVVNSDDLLLQIFARGMDSNSGSFRKAAGIRFEVDGTPGSSDMPGRILFQTTPDGSATPATVMTIKNTGNVGIGTTIPIGIFEIESITAPYTYITNTAAVSTSNVGALDFRFNSSTNERSFVRIQGKSSVTTDATREGQLDFFTNDAGTFAERMTIKGGNVGIGTTGPIANLHVVDGDASLASPAGNSPLVLESTNSDNFLSFIGDADQRQTIAFHDNVGWDGLINYYHNTRKMDFYATGIQTMTLNNGNVGIGTTGPIRALEVWDDLGSYAAAIYNDGNNANRRGLYMQIGADDASLVNYAMAITDGDGTAQGFVTFSSGTVTYGAFTANHDVSIPEEYNKDGYPYGTLMCIVSVGADSQQQRKITYLTEACRQENSNKILGVYAGKYDDKENLHQVYVLGDGHIRVNNEGGNIQTGDPITVSSQEGIGMKANTSGMIIGYAQEDHSFSNSSEEKLITVQYGINDYVGNNIHMDKQGNIGIGTTNPTSPLYVVGNVYSTANISALSFTDRTPYPKDLQTAYDSVMSMQRLPIGQYQENNKEQQLDHSKLSDFIKSGEGRDLSATVSAQNEVIKDLIKRIKMLEKELESLKNK